MECLLKHILLELRALKEVTMTGIADFQAAKDRFSTALAGIAGDVQSLKDLLAAAGSGGLNAADTATALEIVNSMATGAETLDASYPAV